MEIFITVISRTQDLIFSGAGGHRLETTTLLFFLMAEKGLKPLIQAEVFVNHTNSYKCIIN